MSHEHAGWEHDVQRFSGFSRRSFMAALLLVAVVVAGWKFLPERRADETPTQDRCAALTGEHPYAKPRDFSGCPTR